MSNMPGGMFYKMNLLEVFKKYRALYGDLLKFPGLFGTSDILISYDPDHFQTIFRIEGIWPERLPLATMEYYRTKMRPDVYGKHPGLVNTNGKVWGDFRKAVNPAMIQPKTTKLYIPTIDSVAGEFIERIRHIRNTATNQLPENFESEINKWTLESTGLIALDTRLGLLSGKYDERAVTFIQAAKVFTELAFDLEIKPSVWRLVSTPAFKKLMKAFDTMTDLSGQYIDEAKVRLEKHSSKSDQDHEQSVLEKLLKIDPNIAKVMAMDMVFAGVETTSSAFTGLLYHLAKNPDKQEFLRNEILPVLPEKNSSFAVEKMSRLPYLRACMKEAQRILPTASGNVRAVGQDIVLNGYQIPKGTYVFMNSHVLQMDEKHYPNPNKFLPERWLKSETKEGVVCPASAKTAHPFIYLPFGFGPRMCIGRRFAEMEVEILISKIVRNFYVTWEHPDLGIRSTTINVPDGKLMFTLTDLDK